MLTHLLVAAVLLAAAHGAAAKVCPEIPRAAKHFNLRVSEYDLRLPDGRTVPQLAYNGSAVGPPLVFTLGDEVSIDVYNGLKNTTTSTHWHGQLQTNTAWADGVDTVSQAAYKPGNTFRYKFKAEPPGTFWYHAHTGVQFADGLRGPLIVQDPKDPYRPLYDEERILMMYDQAYLTAEEELRALQTGEAEMMMGLCPEVPPRDYSDIPYYSLYTNGQGWVKDKKSGKALGKPHVITVQKGKRYRFRTIQGAASWGMKVEPMSHPIEIIAVDGAETERTPAKGYIFTPGERVDFLLNANQPVGNYWINVATLTGSNSPAVLHYEGAPEPNADPKLGAPKLDLGCRYQLQSAGIIDFKDTTLRPYRGLPKPPAGKATSAHVVYLTDSAVPSMSKESVLGPRSIYGLQKTVRPSAGCPKIRGTNQTSQYCWSLNWVPYEYSKRPLNSMSPRTELSTSTYVQDIPLGAVVDIAFVNPSAMVHPMHIHGYTAWVLGTGNGNILNADGSINYAKLPTNKPGYGMMRDTVPVPAALPADPMAAAAVGSGMAVMPGMRRLRQAMEGMPAPKPAAPAMEGMGAMPAPKPAAPAMKGMPAPKPAAPTMKGMPAPKPAAPAMKEGMPPVPGRIVSVPEGMAEMAEVVSPDRYGYTVIRFVANNPGVWATHCHIDAHAASGMFFALRVGGKAKEGGPAWTVPRGLDACSPA